jgi:hypothetical protein
MSFRNTVSLTIIFCLSFFIVPKASAHGRTPRLEISVERINPGGVVDIRGVEFDYEEVVTLYLERQGIVIELGQIVADLEGIFIHIIVLPVDLPAGEYMIRGVTEHHDVLSPVLTVQGPAILSETGSQGGRDEDDGLLAPMPTYAPGVVPGGVVQPTAVVQQPVPEQIPTFARSPALLIGLFVLLMLAVFFTFRWRRIVKE